MNDNNIEIMTCSKIKEFIASHSKLRPIIPEQNTIPIWDGDIFVYTDENQSNQSFYGKIPVQVKGHFSQEFSGIKTESVSIADLKNYQKDGGVIYFVVHYSDIKNFECYYAKLLPWELSELLLTKNESSLTISIKPLSNINEFYDECVNFIVHKKKQFTTIDFVPKTREEFDEFKTYELTFSATKGLTFGEQYLYGKRNTNDIPIPLGKGEVFPIQDVIQDVSIGDTKYYDNYTYARDSKGHIILELGNTKIFIINNNNITINYKNDKLLSKTINDLEFIDNLADGAAVKFGDVDVFFNKAKDSSIAFKQRLKYYLDIKECLLRLGVSRDLELDKITDFDSKRFNTLIGYVLYNYPISTDAGNCLCIITLGNINLACFITSTDGIVNKITPISDLYAGAYVYTDKKTNKKIPCSPFITSGFTEIIHCDNYDYEKVYKSITSFKSNKNSRAMINSLALKMISRYDQLGDKVALLYAQKYFEFIISKRAKDTINSLNLLQIKYRNNILSEDDRIWLRELVLAHNLDSVYIACLILLDAPNVEAELEKLDESLQNQFKTFPIYYLIKRAQSA